MLVFNFTDLVCTGLGNENKLLEIDALDSGLVVNQSSNLFNLDLWRAHNLRYGDKHEHEHEHSDISVLISTRSVIQMAI